MARRHQVLFSLTKLEMDFFAHYTPLTVLFFFFNICYCSKFAAENSSFPPLRYELSPRLLPVLPSRNVFIKDAKEAILLNYNHQESWSLSQSLWERRSFTLICTN